MKHLIILFFLFIAISVEAAGTRLITQDFARIRDAQEILAEVDSRSTDDIQYEFNQTEDPQGNLQIHEAVAATYQDLVERKGIIAVDKKKELYDYIRLNVAFIQFGGNPAHQGDQKLNQWIRQTLTRYLPKDLLNNPKLFHKVEEWEG